MPVSFRFQDQADDVMALPFEPIVLAFKDVNYYVPALPGSALAKASCLHALTCMSHRLTDGKNANKAAAWCTMHLMQCMGILHAPAHPSITHELHYASHALFVRCTA